MSIPETADYKLFDVPMNFYESMLEDIRQAAHYIYLEVYKYYDDSIGNRFREALIKKARQGVEVRLLIDSWGSGVSEAYFVELIKAGGKVRFFTKIKFFIDFFTKNHRRNHRKFLIIDDVITYIGSANINDYCMNWREMMLRIKGDLAVSFKKVFNLDFRIYNKYFYEKNAYIRLIRHDDFEIVRDVPSITKKRINKKFIHLIKNAGKDIFIETPYFLPGYFLRRALTEASKRGVKVTVILPKHSDIRLVDLLRNKYLGPLHLQNINFLYYTISNLHAKAMLIDGNIWAIGSPNFDYRSFRYMHEIVLIGKQEEVARQLNKHIELTIAESEPFSYEQWLNRNRLQRFVEWLLLPFRHLL